ncbi:MDR family MFS transporter [Salirhabdus salicampi]|uniref:MDR family MFS transporter n=1 Tax=Salirhabdus salicampi TaxID=476102 RepID=UPI003F598035
MENRKVQKKTRRPFVLAAIMVGMFLAAIEATIVSTAMPTIASELGGFSSYSWVFSAYLLTNAGTVLIFGKLSDIFGRKPIYIIGVCVFLAGSTACAMADSMEMLVAARFFQGIGAGALMPIATTIVGDIYTKEERAKIQGYLSSVWGISAVSGPVLGGFFVDVLSWHYVFLMNIPLGLLAIIGIVFFFHEQIEKEKRHIDYIGSVLMVVSISSLVMILVEGGVSIPWNSPIMYGLIFIFITGLTSFFIQEKRALNPMMPFHIWKYRTILFANLTSFTTGMILIGMASYLPAFVQGVMERSATVAGFTLTTLSIGWPIAATLAGRLYMKIGFRTTALLGGLSLMIGGLFFLTLTPEKGPIWAGTGSFFIGIGMGLSTTSFIVSIQTTVGWKLRGIATATNMFMRTMGSAIGAALLGGLLNKQILQSIETHQLEETVSVDSTNILMDAERRESLHDNVRQVLQNALADGLHVVYIGLFILAIISFLLITQLPKKEET